MSLTTPQRWNRASVLALLGLAGYMHTGVTEAIMFLNTLWLMLGLALANALAAGGASAARL